jgi:hypothetical protein
VFRVPRFFLHLLAVIFHGSEARIMIVENVSLTVKLIVINYENLSFCKTLELAGSVMRSILKNNSKIMECGKIVTLNCAVVIVCAISRTEIYLTVGPVVEVSAQRTD